MIKKILFILLILMLLACLLFSKSKVSNANFNNSNTSTSCFLQFFDFLSLDFFLPSSTSQDLLSDSGTSPCDNTEDFRRGHRIIKKITKQKKKHDTNK